MDTRVDLFGVLYWALLHRPLRAMTEWTLLKRLLDAVHQHSTMIGRLWLTVMVIFRLLVVAVAAEDVYADEQEMFVCDTLQPGCPNVCYDAFAPISQPRFWVFHIIAVSTPSLCFIIYTWHNLSKRTPSLGQSHKSLSQSLADVLEGIGGQNIPKNIQKGACVSLTCSQTKEACGLSCDSDSCSITSHRHLGHSLVNVLEGIGARAAQKSAPKNACVSLTCSLDHRPPDGSSSGVLSKIYVFHVCFRAMLEVGFLVTQWLLFGFRVPAHFVCTVPPCSQRVDCYVSRPTEKTIFLIFMFSVGAFCIFLNFLELNHLGWKKIKRSISKKDGYGPPNNDGQSMTSLTFRDVTSTTSLPTLDLVLDHRPDWMCAGNCSPMKEGREDSVQKAVHKPVQPSKGKVQSHKGKAPKSRGAEVWI
ncbi:gap junction protein delta 6 [Astyanax mexicanus]|uniref:gap junction protein delta 6 n=1 Tax=Astyanax mexicanus TaxID=7994 RepID=UPI0020CAEB17|nr:gap junction protein delta 6 [Astyanax mexicanus]